ncbi:hypothetical protein GCM10022403_056220 [Streptomyces coacervatus]|uniref:Uncharacterized protein n=1 Tax=Streptomyces coacervatus TaxID=647381 RepID=A0ABP7ICW3_9ACTN|nr:hypothetical protein [Streptomyces coacervatus]MDF2269014.1 hypothetical protein [Streptomyces coacervatus]
MASEDQGINIGDISGSNNNVAAGSNAHAESHVHHGTGTQPDEATRQLLEAVRQLRDDLRRVNSSEQTVALGAALAETETEITRTGQAGPTRRQRLRELLADSQALVTFLSSAGAVAGLLGR